MALFIRQNEDRTKLQERLSAELQDRSKQRDLQNRPPDSIDQSSFMKDTKDATSLTWIWVLIAVVVVALIAYFAYQGATG